MKLKNYFWGLTEKQKNMLLRNIMDYVFKGGCNNGIH